MTEADLVRAMFDAKNAEDMRRLKTENQILKGDK